MVVAPNWLGDAVMALPAIADLRRHFGDAHVAIAARPPVAPLFSMVQGIDEVVTLPGKGGVGAIFGWRDSVAALKQGSFEVAVLLPNSFAAAFVAKQSGIAERWGFATDWRGGLLTKAAQKPRGLVHQYEYYQALTSALGITAGPPFAAVRPNADRTKELLLEIGLDPDEPFVVFAPGAAYGGAKQWLPERFAELAGLIINQRGWSVLMIGSTADRSACAGIASRIGSTGTRMNRLVDLSGKTDLPALAGLLSRAHAVVSNDSGAMHLAGAVGAKVVALFGATNEKRTSPLRARESAPPPVIVTHDVFCRPCMLRECPIDHRCMRGISARAVFDVV